MIQESAAPERRYDAIVVGARVAGAGTGTLLARAGRRVLVVDRAAPGTDTTSTHALMRGGVLQLARWGMLPRVIAAGTPPIRTTTFHYGGETTEIEIQARDGIDALYAPRRFLLDALLAQAAREAGARVLHRARVVGVTRDAGERVRGVELVDAGGATYRVAADIVIGADGTRSTVARGVRAGVTRCGQHSAAILYGYFHGVELRGTHWYYGPRVAAGAIPTNDGLTCVFAAFPPARLSGTPTGGYARLFHEALAENDPALARAVAAARPAGKLHPFAGAAGFLRHAVGPGWALVGDAGAFRDPLTAHGMTDALRDAELLARAILADTPGALRAYQAERDALAAPFLDLSDDVASFAWNYARARELHLELSRLMGREYALMAAWSAVAAAPSAA